jgi:hypothetical protein
VGSNSASSLYGGGRSVLVLGFSRITFRLISLVALGGSGDLFVHARDLFV